MPRFSNMLRQLAVRGQYGHRRTPRDYYMTESYCAFYWGNRGIVPDHPTWIKVANLSTRYHRFIRYMEEVRPGWQEVDRIHYADNSVEAIQEDRNGNRRQIMLTAPHGDACF